MACRIQNLGKHRLAVNLRGGEVLYLVPQEISRPLREESLYDNMFVEEWRQRGVIRWIDAKMADVLAAEGGTAGDAPGGAAGAETEGTEPGQDEESGEATAPDPVAAKTTPKRPAAKPASKKASDR